MSTGALKPPTPAGLRRELGLASTTAAVIGGIIAVGIFLTPAGMAKSLGSPLWLLLIWLVVGAMTLSGALCYGELAGRFPRAGGVFWPQSKACSSPVNYFSSVLRTRSIVAWKRLRKCAIASSRPLS
jgi:amino acid transporter